jgi:hypothetical protein
MLWRRENLSPARNGGKSNSLTHSPADIWKIDCTFTDPTVMQIIKTRILRTELIYYW